MDKSYLFESEKEETTTFRVLAALKVKELNETIDSMVSEVMKYAAKIDEELETNHLSKRYLDRVSKMNSNERITLDEDLLSIDFRLREILDDLINRINTRIRLVNEKSETLLRINEEYNLDDIDFDKELSLSMLDKKYYN